MDICNANCPLATLKGLSEAEIKALVISVSAPATHTIDGASGRNGMA